MKKILFIMTTLLTLSATSSAMSYEQARREALFLTDKMAYELNLNSEQYDAAYEINLDYLMGVTSVNNVYGPYWTRRNLDMSYILFDWQWSAFQAATYFYRPLYWSAGNWHFGIYARYPHRSYFYFDRPTIFWSYRGGHGMRYHNRSYYHKHVHHYRPAGGRHHGMRDRHDRGEFGGRRHNGTNNAGNFRNDRNNGRQDNNKGTFSGNRGDRKDNSSVTRDRNNNRRSSVGTSSRSSSNRNSSSFNRGSRGSNRNNNSSFSSGSRSNNRSSCS